LLCEALHFRTELDYLQSAGTTNLI
jgi:hypothetical protein